MPSDLERASLFAMPEAFWKQFAADAWDVGPRVYDAPTSHPILSQAELLQIIGSYVDDPHPMTWLRIGGETATLQSIVAPGSFTSVALWLAAVKKERSESKNDVFLYVPDIQRASRDVYLRARAFVGPLFEYVGFPADCASLDVFLGDYTSTPSSIHRDGHNFTFPLAGRKTLNFWPFDLVAAELSAEEVLAAKQEPSFFARSLRTKADKLEALRKNAIQITIEPGQFVYWPSSYWHCAEGDGSIAETFSIALYPFDKAASIAARDESFGIGERPAFYPHERGRISPPASWYDAIEQLGRQVAATLERLKGKGPELWALRKSVAGFNPPPKLLSKSDFEIHGHTALRGDKAFPASLIGRRVIDAEQEVRIASGGRVIAMSERPASRVVGLLLDWVARGEAFKIDEAFAEETDRDRQLALKLARELVATSGLFVD